MPDAGPVAVAAPRRVVERLRAAPDGAVAVVHAGPDAVYVDVAGWCVGLVSARAVAVPCALRSRLPRLPDVGRAEVRSGVLLLDGRPVVVGRVVDVAVPRLDLPLAPSPLEPARLVGAGDGLTPYGDDVVCGWLAAHRAAGVATPEVAAEVRALLPRTTLLSATLVDCALAGEVVPQVAAYVRALGTLAETAAEVAVAAIGGSSGAGLLEGFARALGRVVVPPS